MTAANQVQFNLAYFFEQNGKKNYVGGDEGNIFRLKGNATTVIKKRA